VSRTVRQCPEVSDYRALSGYPFPLTSSIVQPWRRFDMGAVMGAGLDETKTHFATEASSQLGGMAWARWHD
jgi:hypothetical protein